MITLTVIKRYRSRNTQYEAGQVINVDDVQAKFLMADAPGCFEEVKPEEAPADNQAEKEVLAPPEDKMVKGAQKEK